ncbi:MAG: transcriptional repressor [Candidatus Heimdallarchaeota archaeon]|nr:MAG: transcriptional repressor [Candidatus Heimdallarchaeota archaeon]
MKYTNQRVAILDFLKDNFNHPTVEEIFETVKQKLPRITKATVYKNLKILVANGLIKEVNIKGVSRFEAKMEPHHHIICTSCGKILDFKSKELIDYALKMIENQTEIIIDSAETTFFGRCEICE